MAKHTYRVERHMIGDKPYAPGDTRDLTPAEAAQMVKVGALTDLGPAKAEKAEAEAENKAEPEVENKAEAPAAKKPLKTK